MKIRDVEHAFSEPSKEARRAMFVSYCRSTEEPMTDQRKLLRPDTRERLYESAKVLLDVA